MAEAKKKTTTKKTTTTKKVTEKKAPEAEVKTVIEEAAPAPSPAPAPQPINMVVEQKAPSVKILYIDSALPNNEIPIGGGRKITGSGRVFTVSAEHFEGEFMTPLTMDLIDERKFIILSGLTEEQRQQYNCDYKEGEVLKSDGIFDAFFEFSTEKAAEVFSALCKEHRELVATRFIDAYFEKHDNRITRDKIEALNKISKEYDKDGLFTPILKDINKIDD